MDSQSLRSKMRLVFRFLQSIPAVPIREWLRQEETDMPRKIPQGYNTVQPYLMFNSAQEAMNFYAKAFGAKEKMCMKSPEGRVVHAEISIGDSVLMMADEHPEIGAYAIGHYGGSPVSLLIYVDDCDATYKEALAAGGTSEREPTDQPYGDRMAGIRDPFGYKWWIAHSLAPENQVQS
jgi:PhnB protein